MNPVVVASSINTPYGVGMTSCWEALMQGRTAIGSVERFTRDSFVSNQAALAPELDESQRSRVLSLLSPTLPPVAVEGRDALLMLATTTGEVDYVERSADGDADNAAQSRPSHLLKTVRDLSGVRGRCSVISSACCSSAIAVTRAVQKIRNGDEESVLVVGCDAVSEFVHAGFNTLMALSPNPARPFDRDRDGLTLGEAAACTLVTTPERAEESGRNIVVEIAGTGMSCDANHMTGPSRDGGGLARAIDHALCEARLNPEDVDCICAHGTGTVYNDSMEMKAFKRVFGQGPVPTFSIKGGTGHTMGAAGLLEILIAARSLQENVIPPTVGLETADEEAVGWVKNEPVEVADMQHALCVNSGFGGVNSAVVIGGM